MKLFSFIIFVFITTSCVNNDSNSEENSGPKTCDCNKLILDNGYNRFYLKDKKKPFTGACQIIYPGGKIKTERHFVEGKYHGDLIDYYPNGKIESITQYETHFINGFQKIYSESGELLHHYVFKRSQLIETIK